MTSLRKVSESSLTTTSKRNTRERLSPPHASAHPVVLPNHLERGFSLRREIALGVGRPLSRAEVRVPFPDERPSAPLPAPEGVANRPTGRRPKPDIVPSHTS